MFNFGIKILEKLYPDAEQKLNDAASAENINILQLSSNTNSANSEIEDQEDDEIEDEEGEEGSEVSDEEVSDEEGEGEGDAGNEVAEILNDDGLVPLVDTADLYIEREEQQSEKTDEYEENEVAEIAAAVEAKEVDERTTGMVMKTLVDGKLVNTNSLLKGIVHGFKKSSDRETRVATKKGSCLINHEPTRENQDEDAMQSFVDVVAVIFKSAFGISIAVGRVINFLRPGKKEWSRSMNRKSLLDKSSQTRIQVMQVCLAENEGDLLFLPNVPLGQIVARGLCLKILNAAVCTMEDGRCAYVIRKEFLEGVMNNIYSHLVESNDLRVIGLTSLNPKMVGKNVPYMRSDNTPLLLIPQTQNLVTTEAVKENSYRCTVCRNFAHIDCNYIGNLREIWQHVSGHILLDFSGAKEPLCALCCGKLKVCERDVSDRERSLDEDCEVWVEIDKTRKTVGIYCKEFGKTTKLLSGGGEASLTSPSTNKPIMCSSCPTHKQGKIRGTFIWKYCLQTHCEQLHGGVMSNLDKAACQMKDIVVYDSVIVLGSNKKQKIEKSRHSEKSLVLKKCENDTKNANSFNTRHLNRVETLKKQEKELLNREATNILNNVDDVDAAVDSTRVSHTNIIDGRRERVKKINDDFDYQ